MRRIAAVVMITAAMVLALGTPLMAQELMKVTGWVSKIDAGHERDNPARGGTPVTVIMGNPNRFQRLRKVTRLRRGTG